MTSSWNVLALRLLGAWTVRLTHTHLPGEVVLGRCSFERLGDDGFLVQRTQYDHPELPDALALYRGEHQHYFDARGVVRLFTVTTTPSGWSAERPQQDDDFGQRMTWLLDDDGATLRGQGQLSHDGVRWEDDVTVVCRRSAVTTL